MRRRTFLTGSLATGLGLALPVQAQPAPASGLRFDRAWLKAHAAALAQKSYAPPRRALPAALRDIDYDAYRNLRFRPDAALWAKEQRGFTVQFFHLGFLYREPVAIYEVVDGLARPVSYSPQYFDFSQSTFKGIEDAGLGFAGFRLHAPLNRPDYQDEVAAFLGASYFRCLGRNQRYGKSARGLAINTASPKGEEFPRFSAFWLERPPVAARGMALHALLEGPSATGAFSFALAPGASTVVDVEAEIYPRAGIDKVGLAPLTSMYFFGENNRADVDDFRPEVHDSDGLALWTGAGEWIWRPLVNPSRLRVSSFYDRTPRGFGLMQRDRAFQSYEDLEARYDLRPSVWVEPKGDWGAGAVELVEIPTDDETNDNIVAAWVPSEPVKAGAPLSFAYRLYWCTTPPIQSTAAIAVATRAGDAGVPGQPRIERGRKFAVEFQGGLLGNMREGDAIEAMVSASGGKVGTAIVEKLPRPASWRTVFDVVADGTEPVELRCFLKFGETALTETWSYQWTA